MQKGLLGGGKECRYYCLRLRLGRGDCRFLQGLRLVAI